MEALYLVVIIALLALFLGSGIWIGPSLFVISWIMLTTFTDLPVMRILGSVIWNNVNSSSLMALPLFIMMGEILAHTKISENLFEGLTLWWTPMSRPRERQGLLRSDRHGTRGGEVHFLWSPVAQR